MNDSNWNVGAMNQAIEIESIEMTSSSFPIVLKGHTMEETIPTIEPEMRT